MRFSIVLAGILAFTSAATAEELPPGIYVLDQGEPAPYPGILLNEERAQDYARIKIRVAEQDLQLQVREAEIVRLSDRPEPGWLERNQFFVGVVAGIALSAALAYGAVKVADEFR